MTLENAPVVTIGVGVWSLLVMMSLLASIVSILPRYRDEPWQENVEYFSIRGTAALMISGPVIVVFYFLSKLGEVLQCLLSA